MKTSSKILTGLLSTIFIVIVAIFVDIRVFGKHKSERYFVETRKEKYQLEDFTHLYVDEFKSLKIVYSDKNYIEAVILYDSINVNINYSIHHDTLKINGNSLPSFSSFTLYTNSPIESISVMKSNLRISGFSQDNIYMKIVDGGISNFGNSEKAISYFKHAEISELNSKINFYNTRIDTLELDMENSNAQFNEDIGNVNASIKSNSKLHLKNAERLDLEKDKDSRIYMR